MKYMRIVTIILFLLGLAGLYYLIHEHITLANFKQVSAHFKAVAEQQYELAVLLYGGVYALFVILAIPIIIINLVGGFLFGTWAGALYTTAAAIVGSVISFLIFRYLLGNFLRQRMGPRLTRFNEHVQKYGMNYLLMLHYSSVVPFLVINSLAALTNMRISKFIWVTILGVFPVSLIYAFAGRQFGSIQTVGDIFSPAVIVALVGLVCMAFAPIIWRKFKGSSIEV